MAKTRLRRIALGLSLERHRPLPSGSPGGRRLSRPTRDSRPRTGDDLNASAGRSARAGPKEVRAGVGRAIAVRAQGYTKAAGIPLERRKRRQTEVLVRRRPRERTRRRKDLSQDGDLSKGRRAAISGIDAVQSVFR